MNVLNLTVLTGLEVMAGVSGGKRALEAVNRLLDDHAVDMPLVLDFQGVEVVAGSALRYLVQGIRKHPACSRCPLVLANLNEPSLEEAQLVAEAIRMPFICAELAGGVLSKPVLQGPLDEKMARTLMLVLQAGEADAQTVRDMSQESSVVTAWNNRLVALHVMGLLRERKSGKRKFYSPVIEGLSYGS